jgi:hypothetical protein
MASLTSDPTANGGVDASETKQEQERTGSLAAAAKRHFRGAGARLSVARSETCEWILFGCSAQRRPWRKVMMGIRSIGVGAWLNDPSWTVALRRLHR